jgi:predicted Zn-dependent peptidase
VSPYKKELLDNGIRVVGETIPWVRSFSLGIWVEVGSRHETTEEAGLSHFLEHMFFKGTERRTARQIAQEMDAIGGEINAFTTRETTTFYAKALDEHLPKTIELMADIFYRSRFDPKEMEREKQVVLEEIRMVEDDPEDLIYDLHARNVWGDHPLGLPILGSERAIRGFSRGELLRFMNRHYRPERIVIAIAGRFSWSRVVKLLNRHFARQRVRKGPVVSETAPPPLSLKNRSVFVQPRPLNQVHLCFGMKGLPVAHKDRYGLVVLNTLLGGSASSRLFQEVRERRGLAYSIYSSTLSFRDAGLTMVYAATAGKTANRVVDLTLRELKRLREKGVDGEELARTLDQIKGGLLLSLESTSGRMNRLARDEIFFGKAFSVRQDLSELQKVTRKQLKRLGEELMAPQALSLTLLGRVPRSLKGLSLN